MGRRNRGRDIHGIVLLDKPAGLTSNEALQRVKRLFQARKAGHTGSLDPLASGMLPICLGEATKVSGFLLDADKTYQVRCRLGEKTATGDAEGEVTERLPAEGIARRDVERVLLRFTGSIEQVPPMYSALKHGGERLYRLARRGIEVERKPRQVAVHELTLVELAGTEMAFHVRCSKGTYIRTLAEDIGDALGCGAHVIALRRTAVGPYQETGMIGLEALEQRAAAGSDGLAAVLLPMESALADWPDVRLSEDAAFYVRQGQAVVVPHAPTDGWVRLYDRRQRFMGVGQVLDDGRVAPRRLIAG